MATPAKSLPLTQRITAEDIHVVYQPIVDLEHERVYAHEVLARCWLPDFRTPQQLFARAAIEGTAGRLGRIVRKLATPGLTGPVFLNMHLSEAQSPWLVAPDDPLIAYEWPIYLEISAAAIPDRLDAHALREFLDRVQARLVVDDFDLGECSLERVLDLAPDVVKLDRSMILGIEHPVRKNRMHRLCALLHSVGAIVIAEGIEQPSELAAVRRAGVDFAQGYLLGKPGHRPWNLTVPHRSRWGRA